MDELQPTISPPITTPPVPTSAPSQLIGKPKSYTLYFVITGLLCLGILIATVLYLRTSTTPNVVPVASVTPTIAPTPTPPPNISGIASTSAFTAYSQEIASFSAILDSFTLHDSTLAPPIMDTDLGLSD